MNSEKDEKNKWLRHRIKIFVSYIFKHEYEAAEDEAITQKEYFDANEVYLAAKEYHYGTNDFPSNYSIAVALYEWAHTGVWLLDYDDGAYEEPNNSVLYKNVKEIDADSFMHWRKAVEDEMSYASKFNNIYKYEHFPEPSDYIVITGALLGNKKCIEASIDIYEILAERDEDYLEQYKPYLQKIFDDNKINISIAKYGWRNEYGDGLD